MKTDILSTLGLCVGFFMTLALAYNTGIKSGYQRYESEAMELYTDELELVYMESIEVREELFELDAKMLTEKVALQDRIRELKKQVVSHEQNRVGEPCFKLDDDWVQLHDAAVNLSFSSATVSESGASGPSGMANEGTGGTEENGAIMTVVDNYAHCAMVIKQLRALQDYVSVTLSQ